MTSRLLILMASLAGVCIMLFSPVASAFDLYGGVDCSGDRAKTSVCVDKNPGSNPISGSNGILLKITDIVAVIAGMAAVILLIVGSLRFITSGGDTNKASSAKSTVANALIGLLVIALAASLITFVVNRL